MTGLTPKTQDATLRRFVGGYPTTYTNIAVKCRFIPRIIRSRDGSTVLSRAQIVLDEVITTKDRVIYAGVEYAVSDVNSPPGIGGEIGEYTAML